MTPDNLKFPCFDDVPCECLLEDNGECSHLSKSGKWEDCSSGALSEECQEYLKITEAPTEHGYYLIWGGPPHRSNLMGTAYMDSRGLYWDCFGRVGSIVVEWEDGWQWSPILVEDGKDQEKDFGLKRR